MIWSEQLTSDRKSVWFERTGQSPAQWPVAMREGVLELSQHRSIHCGEDMVEVMAEWMVKNPGV
jgi:hypothetical protein